MTSPRHSRKHSRFQQCLRIAVLVVAAMFLLVVIMMFALWHYRTPLLNEVAKPRLEMFLSTELAARVTIEQLALDSRQLRLRGMTIDHADLYHVTVPDLILDFTLGKLWRGRLSTLRLEQPEIVFKPALLPENNNSSPIRLRKPPISIDMLTVYGGRFNLELTDQTVEVSNIEFDLHHAPSGNLYLSFTMQEEVPVKLSATGQLLWDTDPELQLNELNIDGRPLLNSPLTLRPEADGLALGGELVLSHLDRSQLDPWLALGGVQQRLPDNFDFSLQNLHLGVEIRSGQVHGQLAVDRLKLIKEDVRFQINNVCLNASGNRDKWRAAGEAQLAEGSPLSFAVQGTTGQVAATAQGTFFDLARLSEVLGKQQVLLPVSGGLEWSVGAELLGTFLELNGEVHGLEPQPSIAAVDRNLSQFLGNFQMSGPVDDLSGNLNLDLAGVPLLTLEGNSEQLVVQLHRTSVSSLAEMVGSSHWPQSIKQRGWLAGQIQLNPTAEKLQGYLDFSGEDLQAAGFTFGASRISSRFQWQQEQLVLTDLSIDSATTGHGASIPVATLQGVARWHARTLQLDISALKIDNLEYLSGDDMSALAGGSLDLAGTVVWDKGQQRLHSDLQGSVRVQEALIHSFYGDLSQMPIDFDLQAAWDNTVRSLKVNDITFSLPAIGQVKGHGNWHSGTLDFGGKFLLPQLEKGFTPYLRPLLKPLIPELEQLDLSGNLAAVGDGSWGPEGWNIAGVLHPDTLGLKYRTADISVTNLSGEVPFAFSSSGETSAVMRNGFVTFTQFQTGPLVSVANHLTLMATTNRLTIIDPWKLSLAGGHLLVENLSFGRESDALSVSGRTHIDNIDLQELTQTLELTPMQGSMTADLGDFKYMGGVLQSEGKARIDVFGGTIQLRNLRARDIFSSYRSFAGDIDIHGIDLNQLTRTFEFGEINGIIDGYIHELRLFGKVPSAFVAELATRNQGERNISVKALNNLTVISQGRLSAALSRGIYRFIDFYRYRKISLFCALRNDVFVLKGTARSDSDLHLVDGGMLPPRINVLAPGTGVSFREMLRRLERIDRTATH
ncbi:MAG: hypothetical protein R6V33_07525 [Pelovirga sp.]